MYQTQKALCHFNPPSLRFLRVFCSPSAPSAHSGWVPTAHSAPTAVPHRRSASEGTPQNGGTPQDPRGGALERSPSSGLCPRLPRRASHAAPGAPRRARWVPAAPAPHTADAARPPELPRGTAPNPRPRVSPPGTESAAVSAGPGSGQGAYITPLGSAGQGCEPHGGRPALTCCGCLGLPAAAAPSPPPSSRRAPRSCWLPAPLRRRWRRRRERRGSRQPITKALRPNGQATPPVRMRGESRPRPPRPLGTPPSVRRFAPRLGQRCGRRRSGRGQVGGNRWGGGASRRESALRQGLNGRSEGVNRERRDEGIREVRMAQGVVR